LLLVSMLKQYLLPLLSLFGLLVSIYLVFAHFSEQPSFCDLGKTISCSAVTGSAYGRLFNVPVAIFGVTWFGFLLLMTLQDNNLNVLLLIFFWTSLGVGFVFYLVFAEIMLQAICPLCTVIHIITLVIYWVVWKSISEGVHRTTWSKLKAKKHALTLLQALKWWFISMLIVHGAIVVYFNTIGAQQKVFNDSLPRCLTERGFKMYGSSSCSVCLKQKKMFGEFFASITFIECQDFPDTCGQKNVTTYPTWIRFEGNNLEISRLSGLQSIEQLQAASQCSTN